MEKTLVLDRETSGGTFGNVRRHADRRSPDLRRQSRTPFCRKPRSRCASHFHKPHRLQRLPVIR